MSGKTSRARAELNARVVFTLIFFALGGWCAVTRHAVFMLGRRSSGIHVDASGYDALAIALAAFGLGFLNLALGLRSQKRIPVFWCGASLLGAAVLYGLAHAVFSVASLWAVAR